MRYFKWVHLYSETFYLLLDIYKSKSEYLIILLSNERFTDDIFFRKDK